MSENTIGFGGNITGTLGLFPRRKPVLTVKERKDKIISDKSDGDFKVVGNKNADDSRPLHTINLFSEVKANEKTIEKEAKNAGVDPNFVKAIIYVETTQGYYDRLKPNNRTIRPMNIHKEYWKDLGYSEKDLYKPEKNIQVGVELIKRIKQNMPYAPDEEIASVYNSLDARHVTDYGKRVKRVMKEKPWENK